MIDKHYTPDPLAHLLVSASRLRKPRFVADFTMGTGKLLEAARSRWPKSNLLGVDIDPDIEAHCTNMVHLNDVDFILSDFLVDQNRKKIADRYKHIDVILLNPPFSNRGSLKASIETSEGVISCGLAMGFVAYSLELLARKGELLCILPVSCFSSERDASIWRYIKKKYQFERIGEVKKAAFPGCSVNIGLVRIVKKAPKKRLTKKFVQPVPMKSFACKVHRGTKAVSKAKVHADGMSFIHTTNLKEHQLLGEIKRVSSEHSIIYGSFITVPRVGRFNIGKVVLVNSDEPYVLSDCVFALQTEKMSNLLSLKRLLIANASALEDIYGGSCAPYTTLAKLKAFLLSLGVAEYNRSSISEPLEMTPLRLVK